MPKKWEKPKLIVLVKGRPEEAVLLLCKTNGQSGGPQSYNQYCDLGSGPSTCCNGCAGGTGS